jgi:streptomycin 6-kinase
VRFAEPSITSLIAWPTSPLAGKADTYHFEVANAATHMMTTEGPSDTVLTLHGPADPDAVLAWDDRGRAANGPHGATTPARRVLAVRAP